MLWTLDSKQPYLVCLTAYSFILGHSGGDGGGGGGGGDGGCGGGGGSDHYSFTTPRTQPFR